MFKKTIEYEDFDGNKQSKDFYFHLSKAELLAMASQGKAMEERINNMVSANDGASILHEARELIKLAVGVRSEDNQRFVKDDAARSELLDSPAFDELLMELATSADAMTEFVKQLVPEKMQQELQKQLKIAEVKVNIAEGSDPFAPPAEDKRPAYQKEHRQPTNVELQAMSKDELVAAITWKAQNAHL